MAHCPAIALLLPRHKTCNAGKQTCMVPMHPSTYWHACLSCKYHCMSNICFCGLTARPCNTCWLLVSGLPFTLIVVYQPSVMFACSFPISFWGTFFDESLQHLPSHANFSWKAVRVSSGNSMSWKYGVLCNGEHELYDLINDPDELDNLYDR